MSSRLRAVVADDSRFVCELVRGYLEAEDHIDVVAVAYDGATAIACVEEQRPDVLTLDLEMPDMNGLEVVREVMRHVPTPIVILSGVSGRSATMALQALDDGAVDFVLKFSPELVVDPVALRLEIVAKVKAAARVHVVRSVEPRDFVLLPALPHEQAANGHPSGCRGVVVIGASTGGPVALRELLSMLRPDFPWPIVVVQHLPASFTGVLAAQLDRHVSLHVTEAADGDALAPGRILIAPGDFHLLIEMSHRVALSSAPEIEGHRPAIDVTLQSAARVFEQRTVGVLLTGMGKDGVDGLFAVRKAGGATWAQDPQSCVVDGMPRQAIERGVAGFVATPQEIARQITEHVLALGARSSPGAALSYG